MLEPDATIVLVGGQNGVDGDGRIVGDDIATQTSCTRVDGLAVPGALVEIDALAVRGTGAPAEQPPGCQR